MRIQLVSDLHLEFDENWDYLHNNPLTPSGDILVVAGDAIYLGDPDMMRFDFFDWCANHFTETLIVPGNHEFYGGFDIADTLEGFELEVRPNVRFLNNRSWRRGETELFFTTLWQRYRNLNEKLNALTLLNDYENGIFNGKHFEAFDVNDIHARCATWLGAALDSSAARTKVVVTHHCPYINKEMSSSVGKTHTPCYMADMTDFILAHRPDYWLHGHVHRVRSKAERIGGTMIYSNPLGYVFQDESEAFDNNMILDL